MSERDELLARLDEIQEHFASMILASSILTQREQMRARFEAISAAIKALSSPSATAAMDVVGEHQKAAREAKLADFIKDTPAPASATAATTEPVCFVRTKDGEIDWSDDCLSQLPDLADYDFKNGYEMMPLYAAPAPASATEPMDTSKLDCLAARAAGGTGPICIECNTGYPSKCLWLRKAAAPAPAQPRELVGYVNRKWLLSRDGSLCTMLFGQPTGEANIPVYEGTSAVVEEGATRHAVIKAAYRPGPMCRDCADHAGRCPTDGTLCDPFEAALERLRGPSPSEVMLEIAAEYDKTPGREAFTTTIADELREIANRPRMKREQSNG